MRSRFVVGDHRLAIATDNRTGCGYDPQVETLRAFLPDIVVIDRDANRSSPGARLEDERLLLDGEIVALANASAIRFRRAGCGRDDHLDGRPAGSAQPHGELDKPAFAVFSDHLPKHVHGWLRFRSVIVLDHARKGARARDIEVGYRIQHQQQCLVVFGNVVVDELHDNLTGGVARGEYHYARNMRVVLPRLRGVGAGSPRHLKLAGTRRVQGQREHQRAFVFADLGAVDAQQRRRIVVPDGAEGAALPHRNVQIHRREDHEVKRLVVLVDAVVDDRHRHRHGIAITVRECDRPARCRIVDPGNGRAYQSGACSRGDGVGRKRRRTGRVADRRLAVGFARAVDREINRAGALVCRFVGRDGRS